MAENRPHNDMCTTYRAYSVSLACAYGVSLENVKDDFSVVVEAWEIMVYHFGPGTLSKLISSNMKTEVCIAEEA